MAVEKLTTSSADPNDLQAQIDAAEAGTVIHLPAKRIRGNFVISKAITLRGAGADRTIVDGCGRGAVFSIDAAEAEVRIEEMAITGGRSALGGGISVDNGARVFVVGCLIERNLAATGRGGGIAVDNGAIFVSECTLAGNRAQIGGGVFVGGGARAEIAASIIAENVAVRGGALAVVDDASVDVWTSRLEQNEAEAEGHHIYTYGTRTHSPRILLSNALLSNCGASAQAIANHKLYKAQISIDNSAIGRALLPVAVVG
jgi:hypothetical protein